MTPKVPTHKGVWVFLIRRLDSQRRITNNFFPFPSCLTRTNLGCLSRYCGATRGKYCELRISEIRWMVLIQSLGGGKVHPSFNKEFLIFAKLPTHCILIFCEGNPNRLTRVSGMDSSLAHQVFNSISFVGQSS